MWPHPRLQPPVAGHIFAGFNRLDVDHTGKVSLHNFRTCLMDIFAEQPDASHVVLLATFCQDAFNLVSGYSSLDSMFGTVFSQWRRMRLEDFGRSMYNSLVQDAALEKIFRRERMRTQSLLFAAFIQVALSWLEERDFRKVERDMISLGLRHRSYGIQPAYVCIFQIALLQTLSQNLNGLSLQAEISWSVVWSHFVVAPFLQGLVDLDGERPVVYRAVKDLLAQTRKQSNCVSVLMHKLHTVVGGFWDWNRLFRDPEHEQQHLAMLLGFLNQVAAPWSKLPILAQNIDGSRMLNTFLYRLKEGRKFDLYLFGICSCFFLKYLETRKGKAEGPIRDCFQSKSLLRL